MKKAKKVINNPKNVVPELLDGLVEAYHGKIGSWRLNGLVKTSLPRAKVGLLIGGGSGHEPSSTASSARTWVTAPPAATFSRPLRRTSS
jgi:dihydroxyacetone kinase-like protein